jgi:hypothetical protein
MIFPAWLDLPEVITQATVGHGSIDTSMPLTTARCMQQGWYATGNTYYLLQLSDLMYDNS